MYLDFDLYLYLYLYFKRKSFKVRILYNIYSTKYRGTTQNEYSLKANIKYLHIVEKMFGALSSCNQQHSVSNGSDTPLGQVRQKN